MVVLQLTEKGTGGMSVNVELTFPGVLQPHSLNLKSSFQGVALE
jgi:hypothetical protein